MKHADYERDIQDFNTAVYDSEGDEIEDDGQRHMDNVLNEEVPFGDIRFEGRCCLTFLYWCLHVSILFAFV